MNAARTSFSITTFNAMVLGIGGVALLFGSDEERQAVREAIEACGVDILSLDAATEGELTAALESLKK